MELKTIQDQISDILRDAPKPANRARVIVKSHDSLWREVLSLTEFLDNEKECSAIRRVWHVMNEVWSVPLCPVSNKPRGWHCYDHGYHHHADRKSSRVTVAKKIQDFVEKNGHWRDNDTKKAANANKKFSEGFRNGKHKPWSERDRDYDAIYEKSKQTCIDRYGVDNYWKSAEMRELNSKLMYDKNIANGCTPRELRDERRQYYDKVWEYTDRSWYEHYHDINPGGLVRSPELHLDHIYSIQQGFMNGIAPEIIGHYTNLRLLSRDENSSKRHRCDKTIEQLYEDYEQSRAN